MIKIERKSHSREGKLLRGFVLVAFSMGAFSKSKGAIKLHTLLDLRGPIPSFIDITDGKFADVNILDILIPEADHFISWTAAMSTSRVCMPCIRHTQRSSPGQIQHATPTPLLRAWSTKTTGLRCDQTIL